MNKILLVLTFILFIVFLGLIYVVSNYMYFSLQIPMFPKEYSISTFLISIFNALFWSLVVFWIYKWKKDRENKLKDDFINYFDKIYDEIIDIKNNNKKFYFDVRIKERSFNFDVNLAENYKEDIVKKHKILTQEQFEYFVNDKILNLYYDLFNILYLKKDFLKDKSIKWYICIKLLSLWKLDFYVYVFLYLNFILSNNSTIKNISFKELLKPYNFIQNLNNE